jgi:hypothetical protein
VRRTPLVTMAMHCVGNVGPHNACTIALLNIEPLGSYCCARNAWKSKGDCRYFPHNTLFDFKAFPPHLVDPSGSTFSKATVSPAYSRT